MIKSMTGFASVTVEDDTNTVGVTLRSVNHRYLDLQLRMPASLTALDGPVRAVIQRRVARGRVELAVNVQTRVVPGVKVEVNRAVVAALNETLRELRGSGLVEGGISVGDLLRMPQAVQVVEQPSEAAASPEVLAALVTGAVEQAVEALDGMRVKEGGFLQADLDSRRTGLGATIAQLSASADAGRDATKARLATRIAELTADPSADPAFIAQEIVRIAARSDIAEEVVRFRAHLEHWRALTESAEPCGRKLDFLLQEMNREINTIGAKAEGLTVPELIVHAKAELERMREQVQNVE